MFDLFGFRNDFDDVFGGFDKMMKNFDNRMTKFSKECFDYTISGDVDEKGHKIGIKMEIPGVSKSDLNVNISDEGTPSVFVQFNEKIENAKKFAGKTVEIFLGTADSAEAKVNGKTVVSFPLLEGYKKNLKPDSATAEVKDGILYVTIPFEEEKKKICKKISIL